MMSKVTVHGSTSMDAMAKLHGLMAKNNKSLSGCLEETIINYGGIDLTKLNELDLLELRQQINDELAKRAKK